MGALAISDLRVLGGEPRIHDFRLGEVLGFEKRTSIRKIIRRNLHELGNQGGVFSTAEKTSSRGGRPAEAFLLNEAQTLLVCMFSRTNAAAEVRAQVIEVFMAWRRGELIRTTIAPEQSAPATPDRTTRWSKLDRRLSQIERLLNVRARMDGPEFTRALAYTPNILFLDHDDGRRRRQRRPRWWFDLAVREAAMRCHRQMTIDQAVATIRAEYGKTRSPARSSLARFWLQLDAVQAAS